jgi:hypothetical protein
MLILRRKSKVSCLAVAKNQCKDVAHKEYEYDVKIKAKDKLNEDGFLVDHQDIEKAMIFVFKNHVGSCEEIAIAASTQIEDLCACLGIAWKKISVTIRPVDYVASVTYTIKSN